jgi:glutamate formiminotransferase / 5-formyltetrahydrofolate cyclo-ligase
VTPPILLAVPNVSEGRSPDVVAAIGAAFASPAGEASRSASAPSALDEVRLLDVHSDPDHHRSVFTVAARPVLLADALLRGAGAAVDRIDVMGRQDDPEARGQHPHVGALDVAPVVYLDPRDRGAACAEALVVADRIGAELEVPVFLYGDLTLEGPGSGRTRAELRRGGLAALALRMGGGGPATSPAPRLRPDFGPARLHPTAGATLVAAREPLVAFNLQLAPPADVEDARAIAAAIREGGARGMGGLRAIAVALAGGVAQVSMNVERPLELPLAAVVENVRAFADVASAELVGLAPAAALEGFPEDLPMPGFDPARHVIENAIGC